MTKEERKKYMREYMRKRYAEKRKNLVVKSSSEGGETGKLIQRVATATLQATDKRSSCAGSNPAPLNSNLDLYAEAQKRAEAARKYATTFPVIIRPSDIKFQSADWQYNELLKYSK